MRVKPTVQKYNAYTEEDRAVWQLLFDRQMMLLREHVATPYLDALHTIGFRGDAIPDFEAVNKILARTTGWELIVAPELVPQDLFFNLLAQKKFPATCWLRRMDELDYLEEPDMFHDVFGHAPLLTNSSYAAFMETFGQIALKWMHDDMAIRLLSRVYWFTIEFGLMEEAGQVKVYGAGIISSKGEIMHAMGDLPERKAFDTSAMLQTTYRTDVLQDIYFLTHSFEQLFSSLPGIEQQLATLLVAQELV